MATSKEIQVPTNTDVSLRATCSSTSEQHVQISCGGASSELSGTGTGNGQGVEMTDQNGNPFGFVNTGDNTSLTISFWSSANPNPSVFGPEEVPPRPRQICYWAGSQDTEKQESYSVSASVCWEDVS